MHCSDVLKFIGCPIIHVNGDHPEVFQIQSLAISLLLTLLIEILNMSDMHLLQFISFSFVNRLLLIDFSLQKYDMSAFYFFGQCRVFTLLALLSTWI